MVCTLSEPLRLYKVARKLKESLQLPSFDATGNSPAKNRER
jgi:hypothetical protein